jgi:hypothetical protein
MTDPDNRAPTGAPPFLALQSPFLRRSVRSTLVTLALVGMTVAVYWSRGWAIQYVASGLWTLGFLILTPLVMKALMFDGRPLTGLGLLMLKIGWLGLAVALAVAGREQWVWRPLALVAGVTTPLAVLTLRALGRAIPDAAAPFAPPKRAVQTADEGAKSDGQGDAYPPSVENKP